MRLLATFGVGLWLAGCLPIDADYVAERSYRTRTSRTAVAAGADAPMKLATASRVVFQLPDE